MAPPRMKSSMASAKEAAPSSSMAPVNRLGSRVLSSTEAGPRRVNMDLCEVLLPAYRTIVDTVAQWKQKSGLRRKVKNKLLQKDKDSRRPVLSPHDVQVAKHCVRALKVLKEVSERVTMNSAQQKGGASREPAQLRWSRNGYTLPLVDAQVLLAPLMAACSPSTRVLSIGPRQGGHDDSLSEQSTFASLSLQCFQLLVSHRLLHGTATKGSLVGEVLASMFICFEQRAVLCREQDRREDLESDILQALVIFCSSPVLEVHGSQLSQCFELLLQVQQHSSSTANRYLAKAAAAQLLHLAALKAEGSSQVVDPAGASTPLTLLPWSSPKMPLTDTVKIVQQCVSQLMEEVALPEQAGIAVLSISHAKGAASGNQEEKGDLGIGCCSSRHNPNSSSINIDDLPDINDLSSSSRGSSIEDLRTEAEEAVSIVCGSDVEDACRLPEGPEGESSEPRAAVPPHRCPDCENGEGSVPDTPSEILSSTSAATCGFILPPFGMPVGAARRSSRASSGQIMESVVIEDEADEMQDADSKTAELKLSVVQWSRTDSCGSAATSSSNISNGSFGSATNRNGPGISASGPLPMQAVASEGPARKTNQGELLPQEVSVGNLESMDRLFAEREFLSAETEGRVDPCGCSMAGEGPSTSDTLNHQDTVLLIDFLCSSLTRTGATGHGEHSSCSDVPGRVSTMEQLLWLLDCCGPHLVHCDRVATVLKQDLCPALLHFWTLADPSTFGLCYSVLLRLVMLFTRPLLPALRLLLPHMLLRPLEQPTKVKSRAVWLSLHVLSCLAQQPQILLELYANLDCRVGCGNAIERSVAALAALSRPSPRTAWEMQHAAGEVLVSVLHGLRGCSSLSTNCSAENTVSQIDQATLSAVKSSTATGHQETGSGEQGYNVSRVKKAKELFQQGVTAFSQKNPVIGLESLREADELECGTVRSDAHLLFRYAQSLDEEAVGDLLGNKDSAELLSEYLSCFDFKDVPIDEALRLLLCNFRIPGEAQKIDRVMEAFARRFWDCNACQAQGEKEGTIGRDGAQAAAETHLGLVPAMSSRRMRQGCRSSKVAPFKGGATTAHVLAFSIIMLHTDAHSPAVKTKMTKEDFIRNNRNLDAGHDIPEAFLSALYDRTVAEEMTCLRGREGVESTHVVPHSHHRHSVVLGARKLKRRTTLPGNMRASTGSLGAGLSPMPSTPLAHQAKTINSSSSGWSGGGGGRLHRKVHFLSAGKSHASSPGALSTLHQNMQRLSTMPTSGRSGTPTSHKQKAQWHPSLPTVPSERSTSLSTAPDLWGPLSPRPFSIPPSTASSLDPHNSRHTTMMQSPASQTNPGRHSSGKHRGFRGTMQRHFSVSGPLLQKEVQRLSLSPRGSLASDLSELPGSGSVRMVAWGAADMRRWKMAMASGICQDRFWPVQHPEHAQALLTSVAPSIRTRLKAALKPPSEDLSPSFSGSMSRDQRHVGIGRSASMTTRSKRVVPPSKSRTGPSLALLHVCMEVSSTLDLPEIHGTFVDLLNTVKSDGDSQPGAKAGPKAQPAVSPLPRKQLDFEP